MSEPIQGRIYIHQKSGGHYSVVANAFMESDETPVVCYVSMETEDFWVRPLSEFAEKFVLLHKGNDSERL